MRITCVLVALLTTACVHRPSVAYEQGHVMDNPTVEWIWWPVVQRCDVRIFEPGFERAVWLRGQPEWICGRSPSTNRYDEEQ